MGQNASTPPSPTTPDEDWEHYRLWTRVREALYALPSAFESRSHHEGVRLPDLHTLHGYLASQIEDRTRSALNSLRHVWDPDGHYAAYAFRRQSQTFPDLVLARQGGQKDVVLGIELKGWYLLTLEGRPTGRYRVSPAACAPQDLLAVIPWSLEHVTSGRPILYRPWVEGARYVAEWRNHWWRHVRETSSDTTIYQPDGVQPYPRPEDQVCDRPAAGARNFGRISRTGLLDDYLQEMLATELGSSGISAQRWLRFLRSLSEEEPGPNNTGQSGPNALEEVFRLGRLTASPLPSSQLEAGNLEAFEERLELLLAEITGGEASAAALDELHGKLDRLCLAAGASDPATRQAAIELLLSPTVARALELRAQRARPDDDTKAA